MDTFGNNNLSKPLLQAITELGFETPTPIQSQAWPVILSGRDVVGIAQTGTGKTLAYLLPLLQNLTFSKQTNPRIVILVPTRELVVQVVEVTQTLTKYMNVRVQGVYGGVNIAKQKDRLVEGTDILVGTPGRLYDLALTGVLKLKGVNKLVIDEVDVMLDLGFRYQLSNIFELLPQRRQNLMFSATMTEEVDDLIRDYFLSTVRISVAVSGAPLENISQVSFSVPNFYSKVNLLKHLVAHREEYRKVLVFAGNKKMADRLFVTLEESHASELCVIHSNKSQNYRLRSISEFDEGIKRIIIATDIMARGLDLSNVTHVINFDTPVYPENYIHRIGRTGRAMQSGTSVLFFTEKEASLKEAIEALMSKKIPVLEIPEEVEIVASLAPEEKPRMVELNVVHRIKEKDDRGPAFHEKKEKNKKTNQGPSYRRKLALKYKKPKTRGDKGYNKKKR